MDYTNDIATCAWSEAQYLFFSGNIWGDFIYYSHLLPALSTLLVCLFVFINARRNKSAQALLFTGLSFTAWSLMDLFLWASEKPELIMFVWSSMIYPELFVYLGSLYFIYAYITDRFPNFKYEIAIFLTFIPLFLFGHTALNLRGFDLTNCWREAIEGPLWQNYVYILELFIVIWILFFAVSKLIKTESVQKKKEIVVMTSGVLLFLFFFSFGNIFGSIESDWELGQIGLLGMPIMLVFISYAVVKFEAFKTKVLMAEALFSAAFLLLLSILFVRTIENAHTIAITTLILFSVLGFLIVKNIKAEILQREEIERLAGKLEKANVRLTQVDKLKSEFVSIASHQLRSPVTSISGYASLLREGTYGPLSQKMLEPVERIEQSARLMAESIEDFLNVSRIESGNMKYHLSDFNLRQEAEHLCDDLRPEALRKGLILLFRTNLTSQGIVHGDLGKVGQILHNLLNNAIKYTPKGSITVVVRDDVKAKRIYVDVLDTGMGMNDETLHSIFQKFERGDRANSVNVKGTGLGLFVALKMAEAMGGTITAYSEGEQKGSRFTFELPLVL